MADTDVFYCEPRKRTGSGGARAVRRDGFIPGVLYGGGMDPAPIRLRQNEVMKAYLNGRLRPQLAKIDVPGEDGQQPVIPRDIQLDPVRGVPIHIDLMRVDEKTRINVEVPVRFINEETSVGLKRGGVLNVVRHEVEIYAPATAIPDHFEIDVAALDIGDAAHASALTLPAGVELVVTDRDFTIATIAAPSAVRSAEDGDAGEEDADAEEAESAEVSQDEGGED